MSKKTSNRKSRRPSDQSSRTIKRASYPPASTNQQEQANRRGLRYARPDGGPRGAERP